MKLVLTELAFNIQLLSCNRRPKPEQDGTQQPWRILRWIRALNDDNQTHWLGYKWEALLILLIDVILTNHPELSENVWGLWSCAQWLRSCLLIPEWDGKTSDVIAILVITNFHLYLIQLWWEFFQIFVYGDVVYAQTWEVLTLKNCIEPP